MSTRRQTSSQRPYLLRAIHEWMIDNDLTPHVVVDAAADGVRAPEGYADDGKLILNISYSATHALSLGNDAICFEARFSGVPHHVTLPIDSVLGIYARETGQGMAFAAGESPPEPDGPDSPGGPDRPIGFDRPDAGGDKPDKPPGGGDRPALKVVK